MNFWYMLQLWVCPKPGCGRALEVLVRVNRVGVGSVQYSITETGQEVLDEHKVGHR